MILVVNPRHKVVSDMMSQGSHHLKVLPSKASRLLDLVVNQENVLPLEILHLVAIILRPTISPGIETTKSVTDKRNTNKL